MKKLSILLCLFLLLSCNLDNLVNDNRDPNHRTKIIQWIVKVTVYGNWCGDGHKQGLPLDSLDECCYQHDQAVVWSQVSWSACKSDQARAEADFNLVSCADKLSDDPSKWPNPPSGNYSTIPPKLYREGLIALFGFCAKDYPDRPGASNIAEITDIEVSE